MPAIHAQPVTTHIGAEISGVDLARPLDGGTFSAIHAAWMRHQVLLWDNRCVMHRRNPFDPAARRVMHRTQIIGDKPYFKTAATQNAAAHA